jgi:hypothetical protein
MQAPRPQTQMRHRRAACESGAGTHSERRATAVTVKRSAPTTYAPTGQCSIVSSRMGKSFGLPVASRPPTVRAAAATRQSACASVRPRRAYSRRHSPARQPSTAPRATIRSAVKSARAWSRSRGLNPRTVSSTLTAHVKGASPPRRSAKSRRWASCRPRRTSIRTVVSRRTAANYPTRRSSTRRWSRTQLPGSSSHSCPRSEIEPATDSSNSQRCSSSSARSTARAMYALRPRAPTRRSSSRTISSSNVMCRRMATG